MNGQPTKCDLCGRDLKQQYVDGRTKIGPWATMCALCHHTHGVGIGIGRGQRFDLKTGKQLPERDA